MAGSWAASAVALGGSPLGRRLGERCCDRRGSRHRRLSLLGPLLRLLDRLPDLIAPLQLVRVQRDSVAQLLERLAERVVERDLVLDVRGRLADLANELPQPGRQIGELLGTEKDEGEHQDDGDLARAEIEHLGNLTPSTPKKQCATVFLRRLKQIDLPRRANPISGKPPPAQELGQLVVWRADQRDLGGARGLDVAGQLSEVGSEGERSTDARRPSARARPRCPPAAR